MQVNLRVTRAHRVEITVHADGVDGALRFAIVGDLQVELLRHLGGESGLGDLGTSGQIQDVVELFRVEVGIPFAGVVLGVDQLGGRDPVGPRVGVCLDNRTGSALSMVS